ncbi:hypothetical protein KL86DES1_10057 [uncultured Desulfovibrio sp.]|uniref:Uncharacterized protein n=1 Tax=uncultured Desulfovibrio sp. TaxID=167968 RepID=A0A212KXB8_9BACT|nr:hypothetical protein KL86DES1_10057 [uncultured Desulfovibrio sp.]VZH35270.1 conserved protein of unknown function [Desulfovibrio sp. 86]
MPVYCCIAAIHDNFQNFFHFLRDVPICEESIHTLRECSAIANFFSDIGIYNASDSHCSQRKTIISKRNIDFP